MQPANSETWLRCVFLNLTFFVGASALVVTGLAAAAAEQATLHAQFCHEVNHLPAAETLIRATLASVDLDPV